MEALRAGPGDEKVQRGAVALRACVMCVCTSMHGCESPHLCDTGVPCETARIQMSSSVRLCGCNRMGLYV